MQINMSCLLLVSPTVIAFCSMSRKINLCPSLLIKEHVINFLCGKKVVLFSSIISQHNLKNNNCILPKHKHLGFGTSGSSLPCDCISERKWGPVI